MQCFVFGVVGGYCRRESVSSYYKIIEQNRNQFLVVVNATALNRKCQNFIRKFDAETLAITFCVSQTLWPMLIEFAYVHRIFG